MKYCFPVFTEDVKNTVHLKNALKSQCITIWKQQFLKKKGGQKNSFHIQRLKGVFSKDNKMDKPDITSKPTGGENVITTEQVMLAVGNTPTGMLQGEFSTFNEQLVTTMCSLLHSPETSECYFLESAIENEATNPHIGYFDALQQRLLKCRNFEELQSICLEASLEEDFNEIPFCCLGYSILESGYLVEKWL